MGFRGLVGLRGIEVRHTWLWESFVATPPIPVSTEETKFIPRSTKAIILCLVATVVLTAADLGSKAWAEENLSTERTGELPALCLNEDGTPSAQQRLNTAPVVLIDGSLELRYAENCGAAFSFMRSAPAAVRTGFFGIAAVVASLVLLWMFATGRGGVWFAWAVPFVVSGAIGNLVDRLRLGYVVDFVRFYWEQEIFGYREWPTFNIADVTILIGVAMLLIDGSIEGRREAAAEKAKAEAEKAAAPAES